ncbi:MAG TPA: nucleotide sugar dehydrogenase [Candidatus Omnitrophota bacterium]|nr:nucleotide sugar dehydrogenase [Candidatus Omnitrophota bacterium]
MDYYKKLYQKIDQQKATVTVIGMGYVGLPLALLFAQQGLRVFGLDLDVKKIDALNRGQSYISDIASKEVKAAVGSKLFNPVSSPACIRQSEAVIICVPTPLNRLKNPDLSFVISAAEAIQKNSKPGQLIILESTTYPGTTDEVLLPIFEKGGRKAGKDFFLCFSPERIDPGNAKYKPQNIPKVVGGITPQCTKLASLLYSHVMQTVIPVSSSRTAEMAKLLENTFRIVNIGLMNELAMAAKSLNVDIWEAIDAAKTKPFGFMAFYPGPGIGGHCIGVDPLYLSWKARYHGTELKFIELAGAMNKAMPAFVVQQAGQALSKYAKKALHGAKILILGVAYKKNIEDVRESPALEIIEQLEHLGAVVSYSDPHVPSLTIGAKKYKSIAFKSVQIRAADLVLIATDHELFDYASVVKQARLIFDTRNVLKNFNSKKIVRL